MLKLERVIPYGQKLHLMLFINNIVDKITRIG
jgi:hypothetical protein